MIDRLLDAARPLIRRRLFSDSHPYGSTVATEDNGTVELIEPWVVISVEFDDLIPVEHTANMGDGIRLRFYHPQVCGGKCTYDVEVVE